MMVMRGGVVVGVIVLCRCGCCVLCLWLYVVCCCVVGLCGVVGVVLFASFLHLSRKNGSPSVKPWHCTSAAPFYRALAIE